MIKHIEELATKQRQLDKDILQNNGLTHVATITRRHVAFSVEVGELANEWRGFKYWSKNNRGNAKKVVEEYADVLHFALSLHNFYYDETTSFKERYERFKELSLPREKMDINRIFHDAFTCNTAHSWRLGEMLYLVIVLGELLGLTSDNVVEAYYDKLSVNYKRVATGY